MTETDAGAPWQGLSYVQFVEALGIKLEPWQREMLEIFETADIQPEWFVINRVSPRRLYNQYRITGEMPCLPSKSNE